MLGLHRPAGPGAFYPADPGRPRDEAARGPRGALRAGGGGDRAESADDAVAIANDSRSAWGPRWTRDRGPIERLVPRIEAGRVFVNGLVKSDPRLPFGGVKTSGYGRELGLEGIRAFVNVKTVWVK